MGLPLASIVNRHSQRLNQIAMDRERAIPLTAPSQSPVPVGFLPAVKPRSGASWATWSGVALPLLEEALLAGGGVVAGGAAAAVVAGGAAQAGGSEGAAAATAAEDFAGGGALLAGGGGGAAAPELGSALIAWF